MFFADAPSVRTKQLQPVNFLSAKKQKTYLLLSLKRQVYVCVQIEIYIFKQTYIKGVVHCTENEGYLNYFSSILIYFSCSLESLCPKLLNTNGRSRELMVPPFCHPNHFQLCEKKPLVNTHSVLEQHNNDSDRRPRKR